MGKRVFVVDDERGILEVFRARLTDMGYEVATAETGSEAVEIIEKIKDIDPNYFSLVLLDLVLTDIDGIEVLKQMKVMLPDLPVVMVSGVHDDYSAKQAIRAGALDYLTKPPNFELIENFLR